MNWGTSGCKRVTLKSRIGEMYGIDRLHPKTLATVLDIGANVGLFSIWARMYHPYTRIIAIEPAKDTYAVLQENMVGWDVETRNYALGETGFVDIINPYRKLLVRECKKGTQIPSYSLTDIMEMEKIDPSTCFIKSDCEFSEYSMKNPRDEATLSKVAGIGFEFHCDLTSWKPTTITAKWDAYAGEGKKWKDWLCMLLPEKDYYQNINIRKAVFGWVLRKSCLKPNRKIVIVKTRADRNQLVVPPMIF